MSIAKEHRYYPCNNCRYKQISHYTRCPFGQKSTCPLYKACDALIDLSEGEEKFHDIPIDLILDVLRNSGYTGELRQTRIVNI